MPLKKSDLYKFIGNKETEVMKEKVNPLRKYVSDLKNEHVKRILKQNHFEDDKVKESMNTVLNAALNLRDDLDWSNNRLAHLMSVLEQLLDEEQAHQAFKTNIDFDSIPEINKAQLHCKSVAHEMRKQFNNIRAVVKSKNTAKQGYEILKELGFDVSQIEPAEKNEVMTLNVNRELLGLPEKGATK